MSTQLTVLASGSSGNASLLEAHGYGLLIDAGLGPRQLMRRLRDADSSIEQVHGLVLTHTHTDHWKDGTLGLVLRRRLPVYLHAAHVRFLQSVGCATIAMLHAARLLRVYQPGEWLTMTQGLRCLPVPVPHDGGPTFGFRFEGTGDLFGPAWAVAYFADLGTWDERIAAAVVDVDVLALEFNHDVEMQRTSGRPWHLINRCLGDEGHLSNEQAAALVRESVARSQVGRLTHLVQLHLSRQCNEPALAHAAALDVLGAAASIHTAWQDRPSETLAWGAGMSATADRCA